MVDYVDSDNSITGNDLIAGGFTQGNDVTHYINDGHPQCSSKAVCNLARTAMSPTHLSKIETPIQPDEGAEIFLASIGVNLGKEHHRETPRRLAAAMKELTTREEFKFTTFEAKSQNMITLGPIPFYTLCAHHTLPFHGNAWIGYVPDERIAGLSKFARAVGYVAKGFHVQEELTTELHNFLDDHLSPKGLAVVMKAEHMCMAMRGVRASGVITTTSEMSGVFADHERTAKAEFMEWIRNG